MSKEAMRNIKRALRNNENERDGERKEK